MDNIVQIDKSVVEALQQNATNLAKKLKEKDLRNDMKGYIDTARALRDTIGLIESVKDLDIKDDSIYSWNPYVKELEANILLNKSCLKEVVHDAYKYGGFPFDALPDECKEKYHRGTGKSLAIAYLAKKYNIKVLCGNTKINHYYKDEGILVNKGLGCRGFNMLLVDEATDSDIKEIKNRTTLIGFVDKYEE